MVKYIGYAVSEETCTIYPFESLYETRAASRDNVERCVYEQAGIREVFGPHDITIHTLRAGEGLDEEIELMARDLVAGGYAPETGYKVSRKIEVGPRETAKEREAREERERESMEKFAPADPYDYPASYYSAAKAEADLAVELAQFEALVEFGETKAPALGIEYSVTSLCLWFEGDTKPHKEWLKICGCRWSKKRQAWYWRIPQAA